MPGPLLQAWNRILRANPAAPAVIDAHAERAWTRAEIESAAEVWRDRFGAGLAAARVIFAEPNGPGWLTIFLGLLKSGAVAAALDPSEPAGSRREAAAVIKADFFWNGSGLESLAAKARRRPAAGCLVKLTSGSAGTPRPFFFTEAQILADGRQICATMGIGGADINLALIPFGHSYGLGNLVVPVLAQGTAVLTGVPSLPQLLSAAIERWRPTVFPAVPPLLRALSEADFPARRLRSLRIVISAGSPLVPELARAFFDRFEVKVHGFYGSSETGGITYDRSGNASLEGRSVGRPLRGVSLVPLRGGRFLVASPAVFTIGNRRNRGSTGCHSPSDLGRPGPGGEWSLLGRAGRLIKIAARRLDPREVEEALRRISGVRQAWVAADPRRSDALAAVVAGEIDPDSLRASLRPLLAPWKIPRRFVIVPVFPLTGRGKVDTARLRQWVASGAGRGPDTVLQSNLAL